MNFSKSVSEESLQKRTHQSFEILRFAFSIAPIIAGLDKFFHILVNWDQYLSPLFPTSLISGHVFMLIVGVIEIIVGIGVWFKPRIFSYIVAAWLLGIIINLLTTGQYFDIALRDFGLFLGALALTRLC